MNIKGLDQLLKHIPELNTTLGGLRFFSLSILMFLLVTAFFNSATLIHPFWLLGGEIVFTELGFLLHYQFFRRKDDFIIRFGTLAYSKAASRFSFPGVTIIFAVVARIRTISVPNFPSGWWEIVFTLLGWTMIVIGVLLFLRTVQVFGLDNLAMLYVYFPEQSRLVDHEIYTILRHPAYSAAQHIAFGLALLNANWFALAYASIFAFGLWCWARLVEEKELIERFGPAYTEYRRVIPAFWPRLRNIRRFFEFLIVGR